MIGVSRNGYNYYYMRNAQGDVIALYNCYGNINSRYVYDSWGKLLSVTNASGTPITDQTQIAHVNPIRYRGYYYDKETGLYSLQSRYYDPEIGRFINADNQLSTGSDLTGMNLFAYCGNNPIMRVDPTGHAWWHWAIAAAVVVVAAAAVVVTAGGAAPALLAVASVANGVAAATTASTVAAGVFIGSATAFGGAALVAASNSKSVSDFNEQGNWGTVAGTVGGGLIGGVDGYSMAKSQNSSPSKSVPNPNGKKGGAAHQAEIAKQTAKFDPSQVRYEVKINTPGGAKPYRYADFSVTQNGQTWYGNVGRGLQSGLPCARERAAISDIQGAGGTIYFFPYN